MLTFKPRRLQNLKECHEKYMKESILYTVYRNLAQYAFEMQSLSIEQLKIHKDYQ